MVKKAFFSLVVMALSLLTSFSSANDKNATYLYFYGQGCGHCQTVEKYFEKTDIDEKVQLQKYEIWFDATGRQKLVEILPSIGLSLNDVGTPFLVMINGEQKEYLMGSTPIIEYFSALANEWADQKAETWSSIPANPTELSPQNTLLTGGKVEDNKTEESETSGQLALTTWTTQTWNTSTETWLLSSWAAEMWTEENIASQPKKFIPILLSGALSDSINPCAFAVMLLLLATILSKSKSKKKTIFAGILFCLAIFLSYFLLGLGFLKLLYATTMQYTTIFKRGVGLLGILIGLANLKDYFWYGKGFVMEVPLAWRPKMMKLIQAVVSPGWAFIIGIIVSLFLLPCSSGPYVTVLLLLGAESSGLNSLGIAYLLLYNLIFILPMIVITVMVGGGRTSAETLWKRKNKHTKLIHLIVGLLMLILGLYIIGTIYRAA